MKRILITSFLLLFIINVYSQQKEVKKFRNGLTRSISMYDDQNRKTGIWLEYYINGEKKIETQYKEGKKDGFQKFYFDSGQLKRSARYKNNDLDGPWVEYYSNGKLKVKKKYEKKFIVGKVESFYTNGAKESIGYWKNGKRQKTLLRYYIDGKLKQKTVYTDEGKEKSSLKYSQDGTLTYKYDRSLGIGESYYKSGKIYSKSIYHENRLAKTETFFENGGLKKATLLLPNGNNIKKTYDEQGELIEELETRGSRLLRRTELTDSTRTSVAYERGRRNGPFVAIYRDNGDIAIQGKFIQGVRDSIWKSFYKNGKLKFSGDYFGDPPNGRPTGTHQYFWPNGKTQKIEKYRIDTVPSNRSGFIYKTIKTGDWKEYYSNGKIKESKTFVRNQLQGEYKLYNAKGQLIEIKRYSSGYLDGKSEVFFDNGKLKSSTNHLPDGINGPSVEYYANGKLKKEGAYEYGRKIGPWKYYYESGQIALIENYFSDEKNYTFYHPSGRLLGKLTLNINEYYTTSEEDFELYNDKEEIMSFNDYFNFKDFKFFHTFNVSFKERTNALEFDVRYYPESRRSVRKFIEVK